MSLYALFPGSNDPLTTTSPRQPTTAAGGGTTCSSRSLYRPTSPISAVVLDFSTMKTTTSSSSSRKERRQIGRSDSFSTTDTTEALSMSTSSSLESHDSSSRSGPLHDTPIIKHDQHLKIQVREVKINFNKLCCTGGGGTSSNNPTNKRGSSSRTSVCRSKRDGRLRRRSCNGRKQDNNSSLLRGAEQDDNFTSYENAIEFDLSVRYGGRNYVARRNLNQIAQLRKDLLEELDFMDKLSQQHHQQDYDDDSYSSSSFTGGGGLDDSYSSISSSSSTDSRIPSLPRMSEAGIFGGGFAQMNGMMQAYRPALESWFKNTISTTTIAVVSEDNPVLSNFLWEPLSSLSGEEHQQQQDASSLVHSNLQQLGSIQEC